MEKLSSNQIRHIWLNYFKSQNHLILPSASLVPINDPSLLWINSGVATLKPYFSGQIKPLSNRLTSAQKCIRTNDIENVGITSRHHTFFEMLGNFSIGDYFKKEAISFAYDLLINHYHLDINKLYFTVYENDPDAYQYWIELGINSNHIVKGNKDRNFWDVGNGPCGPCTEIYYDRGEQFDFNHIGIDLFKKDIENDRYVEIWNIVFSQYNNNGKNEYSDLAQKNIDTGAGLERLACIMQEGITNYDTDLFLPIIRTIEKYTNSYKYEINAYFSNNKVQKYINRDFIVIADHLKASIFAISDGVIPSGKDRGAILRKLIRRAIVCANNLKLSSNFLLPTILSIINTMKEYYHTLNEQKEIIINVINHEVNLFNKTLSKGFELFHRAIKNNKIDGLTVFKLTDTYGFPIEVINSMCEVHDIKYDKNEYKMALLEHQKNSSNKTSIKAMVQQNANLINFNANSEFSYNKLIIKKAKVIAIFNKEFNPLNVGNGLIYLVFDHTCLYATSGGQIHDSGTITINNISYDVIDVIKSPNGIHLHLIDTKSNLIKLNDLATLKVDELKRIQTTRNHSCEHLLQKALQTVISKNIYQQGASKTPEKLTFDFTYANKLTQEDLYKVEQKINEYINSDTNVITKEMSLADAKQMGAQAHFEKVYAKLKKPLRVVIMGNITAEVCGGTHVKNLKDIQQFMITKLESKGSGAYRIEGISGNDRINEYLKQQMNHYQNITNNIVRDLKVKEIKDKEFNKLLKSISFALTRINYHKVINQMKELIDKYNEIIKEFNSHFKMVLANNIKSLFNKNQLIQYHIFNDIDIKTINATLNALAHSNINHIYIGLIKNNSKLQYIIACNNKIDVNKLNAKTLINAINKITHGSGGGNNYFAQGGTNNLTTFNDLIKYLDHICK